MPNRSEALMRTFASAVLIAVVLSNLSYAVTSDRISGALDSGQSVALRGSVHRLATPKHDVGPADPALRFGTIMLQTVRTASQQQAMNRLLAEQQDPKSPNYHKWLTPEQYADRFGLSLNDVKKITSWLTGQGFKGIRVARGREWIIFSGTAAQVQTAFGTEIHRYNVSGEMHVANATSPKIPAALAGIVTGIRGLDDFFPKGRNVQNVRPLYASGSSGFPNQPNVLAPGDIATIYDVNALYAKGIDGTGEKVAVIGQVDVYFSELNDFRTGFGLTPITCTTNGSDVITACSDPHFSYVWVTDPLNPDPGLPQPGQIRDVEEADLGLEWSGAVARGAQIVYVNSPAKNAQGVNTSGGAITAWHWAVDNALAPVISMSYGNCEFFAPASVAGSPEEQELQKANSEGITFVSASGDGGPAGCDPDANHDPKGASAYWGFAVTWPASAPEVTAVGGTSLSLANLQNSANWGTTNGTDGGSATGYITEQAWNDDEEFPLFCAMFTTNKFCLQGGSTAVTGWVPITDAVTAQTDVGLLASGGGESNCATQSPNPPCVSGFPLPPYQTSLLVPGITNPTRLVPDVAMLASANFPGYIFCTDVSILFDPGSGSTCAGGGAAGITSALALPNPPIAGGTSVATPVFAGIVALLDQYVSSSGLSNINTMLYTLAATSTNKVFHQVTTGDSNVVCTPGDPPGFPVGFQCTSGAAPQFIGFSASNFDATTGYNLVTGLGSVDAANLVTAWEAASPSFSLSATALSPASVGAGSSATSTVTLTVASTSFKGTVTFACSGLPTGATCSFNPATATASGTTTLTVATTASTPVGGPTTITVTGTTASGVKYTANVSLTVTGAAFTLTPPTAPVTVAQGSAVDVTVAFGGFSSPVTFTCTEPATLTESTCTAPAATATAGKVSFHITTTAPSFASNQGSDRAGRIFYAALLPGLLGIMFTVGSRKRSLRGLRMTGLIMVLGVSTMWLASCGGSGGGTKPPPNAGTPKGNYTVKVTGTASGNVTSSGTFTLTVQ